jgi:hypothetical protein
VTDEEIKQLAVANGYTCCRRLNDGSVACLDHTTMQILLRCDENGWGIRYRFDSPSLARQRYFELTAETDRPEGFTKRTPP